MIAMVYLCQAGHISKNPKPLNSEKNVFRAIYSWRKLDTINPFRFREYACSLDKLNDRKRQIKRQKTTENQNRAISDITPIFG